MSIKTQSGRVLALVVACLIAVAAVAFAQVKSTSRGVASMRQVIAAPSCADTIIGDGTLVMFDTLTTAQSGSSGAVVGVKPWPGTALTRTRIIGIALGSIPIRGVGQVLTFGVHTNAKVGASGLTAGVPLRAGLLYGRLSSANDSLSMGIGWIISPKISSTADSRAKVFFTRPGTSIVTL